jgi:hypothetical protein
MNGQATKEFGLKVSNRARLIVRNKEVGKFTLRMAYSHNYIAFHGVDDECSMSG